MKTQRIEFIAPRGLIAKLQEEAKDLHISLVELIRGRLQFDDEERELAMLTASLKYQHLKPNVIGPLLLKSSTN